MFFACGWRARRASFSRPTAVLWNAPGQSERGCGMPDFIRRYRRRVQIWIWLLLTPTLTVCISDRLPTAPNGDHGIARGNDTLSFSRRKRAAGLAADTTSPATVTDLSIIATGSTSVTLSFTEVADGTGQPAQ